MLRFEQLERQVHADRMVAAVLIAGGARDVKLPPDVNEAKKMLDEALVGRADARHAELLRALGAA